MGCGPSRQRGYVGGRSARPVTVIHTGGGGGYGRGPRRGMGGPTMGGGIMGGRRGIGGGGGFGRRRRC
jgi:hypothetical protein